VVDELRPAAVDGDVVHVLDEQPDLLVPVTLVGANGVGDVQLTRLGPLGVELVGALREDDPTARP
jgi:hypothetical protein